MTEDVVDNVTQSAGIGHLGVREFHLEFLFERENEVHSGHRIEVIEAEVIYEFVIRVCTLRVEGSGLKEGPMNAPRNVAPRIREVFARETIR